MIDTYLSRPTANCSLSSKVADALALLRAANLYLLSKFHNNIDTAWKLRLYLIEKNYENSNQNSPESGFWTKICFLYN